MNKILLFSFFILFISTSCKKGDIEKPDVPPGEVLPVVELNLKIKLFNPQLKLAEILVFETGGKKLLDTLVTTNQFIPLKVKTKESEFNFTTIFSSSPPNKVYITTYGYLKPGTWEILPNATIFNPFPIKDKPNQQDAIVNYFGFPTVSDSKYWFSNSYESVKKSYSLNRSNGELKVYYEKQDRNFTYLFIPSLNQFKLAEISGLNANLNVQPMGATTRFKFKALPGLQRIFTSLCAYPITNNFHNFLLLSPYYEPAFLGDFELNYPVGQFPQFRLTSSWRDAGSNVYDFTSVSDTVPLKISLLDDSYLKIISKTYDQVNIEFPKGSPTYFSTNWKDANNELEWQLYLPPGKSIFNPKALFTSLKSISLQGKTISDLQMNKLSIEKAENFAYQDFFNALFLDYSTPNESQIKVSRRFQKVIN